MEATRVQTHSSYLHLGKSCSLWELRKLRRYQLLSHHRWISSLIPSDSDTGTSGAPLMNATSRNTTNYRRNPDSAPKKNSSGMLAMRKNRRYQLLAHYRRISDSTDDVSTAQDDVGTSQCKDSGSPNPTAPEMEVSCTTTGPLVEEERRTTTSHRRYSSSLLNKDSSGMWAFRKHRRSHLLAQYRRISDSLRHDDDVSMKKASTGTTQGKDLGTATTRVMDTTRTFSARYRRISYPGECQEDANAGKATSQPLVKATRRFNPRHQRNWDKHNFSHGGALQRHPRYQTPIHARHNRAAHHQRRPQATYYPRFSRAEVAQQWPREHICCHCQSHLRQPQSYDSFNYQQTPRPQRQHRGRFHGPRWRRRPHHPRSSGHHTQQRHTTDVNNIKINKVSGPQRQKENKLSRDDHPSPASSSKPSSPDDILSLIAAYSSMNI